MDSIHGVGLCIFFTDYYELRTILATFTSIYFLRYTHRLFGPS